MDLRELAANEFPHALREIPKPPFRLWMKGAWPVAGTKCLAVVGSHALTAFVALELKGLAKEEFGA